MTHIPDEAVQAALDECDEVDWVSALAGTGLCGRELVVSIIAAAIPHISAPCAVEVNDSGLVNYFKKMQEAAANYIEPTTYKKRFPKDSSKHSTEFKMPHEHHAVSQKHIEEVKRDRAFIDDIIYFLDCPEEHHILSCVVTKPVDVAAVLDQCAIVAECAFDDRPRDRVGHHSHMDWEDGFRDGTRASATAIRTLSAEPAQGVRPLEEWHEDYGDVVWWSWDDNKKDWLGEAPFISHPLSSDWPDYHTHWTPLPKRPAAPISEAGK